MATKRKTTRTKSELLVTVQPFGPTGETLAAVGRRVLGSAQVRRVAGRGRLRLLYVEPLEDLEGAKPTVPRPPSRFRATLYDDTNGRALFADGTLRAPERITVQETALPPAPSEGEWTAAVRAVERDATLGARVHDGRLRIYRPIPDLALEPRPDGRIGRSIAVGLLPRRGGEAHEIVAYDPARRRVIRFEDRLPPNVRPRNTGACGVPRGAGQATASRGTAGQAWVTVSRGGQRLWRFLAVRPAASSGTNGSGIELRYVDYLGKRLLYRAHVPILNVKYDGDACGPYRDWQYQEGMIQAIGVDAAPGFRLCPTPATTILDSGTDTGNFLGVGVYAAGTEAVLVSELQAGWYRYVSQWRFDADGTIRPRFGFAAVEHPCVCNIHHHHAYWRFDFDLRSAGNNRVREFNDPPLVGSSNWHTKSYETRRPRDFGRRRRWRVENTRTGEAYDIVPRAEDGVATAAPDWPFGRGDLWVLRYHGNEIDDGVAAVGPPYEAGLDAWRNGEPIHDHDVVVWYGGHFSHDVNHDGAALHGHIVGPDLRRVRW